MEMIHPANTGVSFDGRALNAYLGAQDIETLSTVLHEALPNASRTLPAVNAFSADPASFPISSALADDGVAGEREGRRSGR
ncbi:MAG: hypothetical protein ACREEM_05700 [Blastocatellia bacterium]